MYNLPVLEIDDSIMNSLVKKIFAAYGRKGGRKGGLVHNPRKGFGTGDNARKAVAIRWAKYREAKSIKQG